MSSPADRIRELDDEIASLMKKLAGAPPAEARMIRKEIDAANFERRMIAHGGQQLEEPE